MTKHRLPIGIRTFRMIREEDWCYVDVGVELGREERTIAAFRGTIAAFRGTIAAFAVERA